MTARNDVLARIAEAHRLAPPADLSYDDITRDYLTTSTRGHHELVELLVDRLIDYKASVRRSTAADVASTVAEALRDSGISSLVVPSGVDPAWLSAADVRTRFDPSPQGEPLTVEELDNVDGVVTGCALAIAETGTLVLDASPDQGRRAVTLVPDYHLCVVRADQVCADVPQAVARLDLTRPTTMISGPSATSDIELNRIEGVHGPRTLEVVLVVDVSQES